MKNGIEKKMRKIILSLILALSFSLPTEAKIAFETKIYKESPHGGYTMKGKLGNVEVNFLLDTGGSQSVVYWPFAEKNQKQLKIKSVQDFSLVKERKITFDKGSVTIGHLMVAPNTLFDNYNYQEGLDGLLLPQSLLKDGYVIMDFSSMKMIGLTGTYKEMMADLAKLYPQKFQPLTLKPHMEFKHLVVDLHVKGNKEPIPAIVDTGGSVTIVHKDYVPLAKPSRKEKLSFYNGVREFDVIHDVVFEFANVEFGPHPETMLFAQDPSIDQEILTNGEKVRAILASDVLCQTIMAIPTNLSRPLWVAKCHGEGVTLDKKSVELKKSEKTSQ